MPDRYLDLYAPLVSLGAPQSAPLSPRPVRYNFGQGLAAPETFPVETLAECAAKVFAHGADALEYFDPSGNEAEMLFGHLGLRTELAKWISTRQGTDISPEHVLLTQGSAQGLGLIANAFVGPGDGVIVEDSTFRCTVHWMRCAGGTIATVPVEQDGMNIDAVEAQLERFAAQRIRPKVIYTIPTFHLPTGTVLSLEKRQRLLELAREWNVIVLEDNVYAELRYAGEPVPSLLSVDDAGSVVQSDSFSKMIAPGIRLGWVVAPAPVIEALAAIRQDLGVSQIIGKMMEFYLQSGDLPPHLDAANAVYRHKRDAAIAAMESYCGDAVRFDVPAGSFYLWVEMSPDFDWEGVRAECFEHGVYYRPGEMFSANDTSRHYFRLAFSYLNEADIDAGIRILGDVVAQRQP
jgi:2-aminoadipate transaminase